MLCPGCRRQLEAAAPACGHCGLARPGAMPVLELVLPDGARVPVIGDMVLGRADGSTLQLADPTVSRTHARIGAPGPGPPVLEDAGSTAGTFVDGARVEGPVALRDGARIRLGTLTIGVERRRDDLEAGRTIVVAAGASVHLRAVATSLAESGEVATRPRLRSGYELKRLPADEGAKRFVLRDVRNDRFLRFSESDAVLLQQLDGTHTVVELVAYAEQRFGATGAARVARLLTDLGDRGLLAGVGASDTDAQDAPGSRLQRWIGPHVHEVRGIGPAFARIYDRGGWVLFLRPVLVAIAMLAVFGLGAFVYLVVARYGTPFVVAERIAIGALIILVARFAFAGIHELAHGLTMASYGRRVHRAGVKAVLVFPYVFVDTSEAWFEPRRRRIAVSAAGPVSDFALGGLFSVLSLVVDGTLREVFFQLAFAGYIGALFNLNPFLERDGYHILVDVLREPGLKKRAREQFERRLSGGGLRETDDRSLARYATATAVWTVAGALFGIGMTLRYEAVARSVPAPVAYVAIGTVWIALFIPFFVTVGRPLAARLRR